MKQQLILPVCWGCGFAWFCLAGDVAQDLTKMSMPVTFNEPITFLQRLCEDLEYSHLLDEAAKVCGSGGGSLRRLLPFVRW